MARRARLVLGLCTLQAACLGNISPPQQGLPEVPTNEDDANREPTVNHDSNVDLDDVSACVNETGFVAGPRLMRRLTRAEFDQTVSDLLGLPTSVGQQFVPEQFRRGFDNQADGLVVSPLLVEQWSVAAMELAALAVQTRLNELVGCDLQAADCPAQFVRRFGQRAFRRPLLDEEVQDYVALFAGVDRTEGARRVVGAMLQSPFFMFRLEVGEEVSPGRYQLTGWEIASSLSYLFWGTMPDQALMDAARQGKLATSTGVLEQAERLLNDPRADRQLAHFASQWLGVSDLLLQSKQDPAFTPALRAAARTALERRVIDAIREGTFEGLMTASHARLSPELAAFVGAPAPNGQGTVDLSADGRLGVMGSVAFLATYSGPSDGHLSIIRRGKAVREAMLCQHVPEPPPNVPTEVPALDATATPRDQLAAHRTDSACAGCHSFIDPVGGLFEGFDNLGRARDAYANGVPVDVSGNLGPSEPPLHGLEELVDALAAGQEVKSCFAKRAAEFAYGMGVLPPDDCLDDSFGLSGAAPLRALLLRLVTSEHFVERVSNPGEAGSAACEGAWDGDGTPTVPNEPPVVGEPGDPTPAAGVTVSVQRISDWGAGYQESVVVTNNTASPQTWQVDVEVEGTIANSWNCQPAGTGEGTVSFSGAAHNATLPPGASTDFGFVSNR